MRRVFQRRNKGVFNAAVLLAALAILPLIAFSLAVSSGMYADRMSARGRIRLENAANGASDELARWLGAHLETYRDTQQFALFAAPLDDPAITVPPSFFEEYKKEYGDLDFSAEASDLYYASAYAAEADNRKLPYIEPYLDKQNRLTRAFRITVTAWRKDKPKAKYSCTLSLRAFVGKDGNVVTYRAAAYDM